MTSGWFLNGIFGCEDVNAAILEAVTRAVWLQGRWQYWTRQAVVDANSDDEVRGPGVLYVPSGFNQDNSAFGKNEFLWSDYRAPTTDPAEATRRQRCPRAAQLNALQTVYNMAKLAVGGTSGLPAVGPIQRAHDAIDGPTSLKAAMRAYIARQTFANRAAMMVPLRDEILRIRHTLIASCAHPNGKGANSYANTATKRIREHIAVTERIRRELQAGPPIAVGHSETLHEMLTRYKLRRPHQPLSAEATHLDVDSLAVRVVNADTSDQNFFPDVWLVLTTAEPGGATRQRQYLLNFPYRVLRLPITDAAWVSKPYPHFEPGVTNRLTVATEGRLQLAQITASSIMIGGDRLRGLTAIKAYGKVWQPQTVRLEINGQQVVDLNLAGQTFGFDSHLDLQYPAPAPQPPRHKLSEVSMKEVAQLSPRVNARRAEVPTKI